MKRKDFKVIFSIFFLLIIVLIIQMRSSDTGEYVRISEDGNYIGTYSLDSDQTIQLKNNTIEIKNKSVRMVEATCPDHLCINQGAISQNGSSIICLPNRVSINITDKLNVKRFEGYYFNTYIEITAYDCDSDAVLQGAMDLCQKYEYICSRTNISSELYMLNHRLLPLDHTDDDISYYKVSDELYDMIKVGLEYSKESEGKFNIAIAPVTELWDFSGNSNVIPKDEDISNALLYSSYKDIYIGDNNLIGFRHPQNMIDLGGIAKGYIADTLKSYLLKENVHSAIISLGHNILCVGSKLGQPFKVGIKEPFSESKLHTSIDVIDKSVVTSGIYERYFKQDGEVYHHIIDSDTGYPVRNDLSSITIISDSSAKGDALSTYLFTLGEKEAIEYDKLHDEIEIITISR